MQPRKSYANTSATANTVAHAQADANANVNEIRTKMLSPSSSGISFFFLPA